MVVKNFKIVINRVEYCRCSAEIDSRITNIIVFFELRVVTINLLNSSPRYLLLNDYEHFEGDMEEFLEAKLETAPVFTGFDFLLPKQLRFLPYEYHG